MSRHRPALTTALFFLMLSVASSQTTWKQVSSFRFTWNGHENVAVVLETQRPATVEADFTRIRIHVPGKKEFTLSNENDGWVTYDEGTKPPAALIAKNAVHSKYLLALPLAENRTALFLFGYVSASSPGSLDVLELSSEGEPRVALHKDELGLKDVRDLDDDGLAEIVGYPCLSEEFGQGLETYDPFNVYALGKSSAGTAELSLPLSKSYNLKHYYGWAGPRCRKAMAVVLHPPTGHRPVLMSKKKPKSCRRRNSRLRSTA